MDPFEEFEFKPLTDGLGFHNKKVSLKNEMKDLDIVGEELSAYVPEVPGSLLEEKNDKSLYDLLESVPAKTDSVAPEANLLKQALPRKGQKLNSAASVPLSAGSGIRIDSMVPSIDWTSEVEDPRKVKNKKIETKKTKTLPKQAVVNEYSHLKQIPTAISAAIFDGIVTFAIAIFFLISLILVTEVDLLKLLLSSKFNFINQMSVGLLFIAAAQIYTIICRGFGGQTLGDWAFDVRLGTEDDQKKTWFPFLVTWRSFFFLMTGIVIIPLLSLIFRRDLAAKITGTKLYRILGH